MPLPVMPPAPPLLSKRMPPSDVAEAVVTVRLPAPRVSVEPVLILTEFAAIAAVVETEEARR